MSARLCSLLLACCLLWAAALGVFSPAVAAAAAHGDVTAASLTTSSAFPSGAPVAPAVADGREPADEGAPLHHLDGLPSPAQADPGAEGIALLPSTHLGVPRLASMAPPPAVGTLPPAPYLETPRRPPRRPAGAGA